MLQVRRVFSGFAVDDLDAARTFYRDTLGFTVGDDAMGILRLTLPGTEAPVIVYPKPDFVPATYTILNVSVDDVRAAVAALTSAGVTMLRYEGMGQDDQGIARGQGPDIAWFNDPAGNIISVLTETDAT
jgi:catechol 2,3-dioxygenase-like lactoylglutathione lyase family enzyme